MVNYHPTINPNDDLAVKYEDIYGCHNDFQIEIILEKGQVLFRTDILVPKKTIDKLSSSQDLKTWGIHSVITELNDKGTAFDGEKYETVKSLEDLKTTKYTTIFKDRVINFSAAKVVSRLTKIKPADPKPPTSDGDKPSNVTEDSQPTAIETKKEDLIAVFGDLDAIMLKTLIW